jgi:hypothetical protein
MRGLAIELLNEPRLGQGNFTMDTLKGYYESGSQVVQSGDSAMGVTVHGKSRSENPNRKSIDQSQVRL